MLSHFYMFRLILFHFTGFCSLLQWNWKMPIIKIIEIFYYVATSDKWCQIWICPTENISFCFISIICVHFSHKTKKFWFWKSLKYFLIRKEMMSDWICTVKQCLIWFKFCCLCSILAINWEIWILNFIEIIEVYWIVLYWRLINFN